VLKYLRIISCFDAATQISSSMQNPSMFTPMSVGDRYGLSPHILVNMAFRIGNTSMSLL